jgi:hypothetical protein
MVSISGRNIVGDPSPKTGAQDDRALDFFSGLEEVEVPTQRAA